MYLNQRDDILVEGRIMKEHNKMLEAVIQRAKDFGIPFNLDKCQSPSYGVYISQLIRFA